jgi:PhnB protein
VQLYPYLNYGGNCRQAFEFYAEHLGARITMMSTFADMPEPNRPPPGMQDDILHARLDIGGTQLLGSDAPRDRFQPMRSAYLTLILDSVEDAERVYALLSTDGEIFMPMAESFFAKRFAMLRDRFGTSWMLMHGATA